LKCFSIGNWVVKSGRNEVLKLSVAMKKRVWMGFSLIHPILNGTMLKPNEIFELNKYNSIK
jgi:hypothetical protein